MYQPAQNGAIQNWLACGPIPSPIDHLADVIAEDGSPFGDDGRWILNYWAYDPHSIQLKQRLFNHTNLFTWEPGASPVLNQPAMGESTWRYVVTEEDNAVDFSRFNFSPSILRGWIYTELFVKEDCMVDAELLGIGPVQIWVNGQMQQQVDDHLSYVATLYSPTTLSLKTGKNEIYVHGLMFGWREQRLALGLRLKTDIPVKISIPLGAVNPDHWLAAEKTLNHLQIDRFAYPELPINIGLDAKAEHAVDLHVDATIPLAGSPWARFGFLELPSIDITVSIVPGKTVALPIDESIAVAMASLPGENTLTLTVRTNDDTPIALHRHVWLSANTFSTQPYGTYEQRREEAKSHLASMSYDIFGAMAAVETGKTDFIASPSVFIACEFMENRYDCADFYALSLLALLYWHEHNLLPDDKSRIENAFRNFKFWIDEPGLDAMCYFTENHQILFHVTAYLTGQRYPDWLFTNSGWTGKQQQDRATDRIQNWILRRLSGSYSEWDSNAYMALDIFAMLALVEFSEDEHLRKMAATLLHKSFFMLAMQSFRGVHGSTHGRCYVEGLKSGRVENTSPLQRIAWGMGLFNGETRATGLLTLARRYRIPKILQDIGADLEHPVVSLARSREAFRPEYDMRGDMWDVKTVTRRTSDYMVSAGINYNPGEQGVQEHLWQATLSPEAVVFTTYPGNSQEHGHARPNFWAGSARLPHVAMHHRTVLCLYQFEPGVGLGFSHAYFPIAAFDDWDIDGQWAFARYGNGYIALWGDGTLKLTRSGKHTRQELRSSGESAAWICSVGSQNEDSDFETFKAKVVANTPQFRQGEITWRTPADDTLSFVWNKPLIVNDTAINWDEFPHYRNQYTDTPIQAATMTITHKDASLVLDLKRGAFSTS